MQHPVVQVESPDVFVCKTVAFPRKILYTKKEDRMQTFACKDQAQPAPVSAWKMVKNLKNREEKPTPISLYD